MLRIYGVKIQFVRARSSFFATVFVEFFGGIAIALGLLTRLASIGIIVIMCVGVWVAHLDDGYFPTYDTYAYQLCLIGLAYSLVFVGGGKYSLDGKFFN